MREIDDILNIDPIESSNKNPALAKAKNALAQVQETYNMTVSDDPRFNEDFEEVRENLREVILEVNDSIKKAALIAQDNEKASSFAALATLVTSLVSCNKQLLDIYEAKKKYYDTAARETAKTGNNISVQNAIFTGTTNDLEEFISNYKKP